MRYSRPQATAQAFGAPFDPTGQDAAKADSLTQGTLELAPHRAWRIPDEPTWRENPFREPNWVAQYHMLRWLDPLRRQAQRGQEEHLDTWLRLAESWISANPPGRGRANYSWADMVEAARALTFCFALPLIEDVRPESLDTILRSIHEHGEWLADETHIRRGNHALQQHQGLLVIGAVLERDDWVDLAVGRARAMLLHSYDEQGVNEEGTPQYHQINYMWWRNLGRRIEIVTGGVPEEFARIDLAPEAMAHATRPDGRYELIGDTEEFNPRGLGHSAIDYVSSGGEKGEPPDSRVAIYDAGYIFGRSGWGSAQEAFPDTSFYSLRFGPQNRIHGHADGMALTLYAGGTSLLVDSGKYAYDATDPFRAHLLSREAHNSLSVDGVEYDNGAYVKLQAASLESAYEHFRFRDSGYAGVELSRDVLISPAWGLAVILDSFTADREVSVSQWWHFNPQMGHRREGQSIFARDEHSSIRLSWAGDTDSRSVIKGRRAPIQGWFSPRWRVLEPTRTVQSTLLGKSGHLATAISFRDAVTPLTIARDASGAQVYVVRRGDDETFTARFDGDGLLIAGQ
ncbi:heparinase II/III domain-containing protein [Ornithinimicrobium panacihumi]|uniref:heparinase II/III domain-containing protein n=1 Tax=Ornithinimicrobium panacihumi TaxID=2008449 RepID=UPI003F8C91E2